MVSEELSIFKTIFKYLFMAVIFEKWSSFSLPLPSIQNMYDYLELVMQFHLTFAITQNSGHIFRMHLELLMAATSIVRLHLLKRGFFVIGKALSLKIAFLLALLHSTLCTAYVVGRALQLIHESGMMLVHRTLKFLMESIISLMLAFQHAKSSIFHTKVYIIILLSGVMPISGVDFILDSSNPF